MKRFIVLVIALVLIPAMAFATNLPSFKDALPSFPTGYTLSVGEVKVFGPVYLNRLDPKHIAGAASVEILAVSATGDADVGIRILADSAVIPGTAVEMFAPGDPPTSLSTVTTSTLTDFPSQLETPILVGIRIVPSRGYYIEVTEAAGLADIVVKGGFWFK